MTVKLDQKTQISQGFSLIIGIMNEKYYFFINSEIFKTALRKSFGHIQFFIEFFVISLWYCIQVALIMFHDGMQLLTAQPSKTHHITL